MVASVPPPSENGGLSAAAIIPMAKEKERKSRSKEKSYALLKLYRWGVEVQWLT